MISYGPFRASHVNELQVQDAQRWTLAYVQPAVLLALENKWSNTVFKNGKPVMCGGVIEQWANNAILWSFVGTGMTPSEFRTAHKYVVQFIEGLPFKRLEMHVDADFAAAHRWAKLLGFHCEATRMQAFLLNGGDGALYARIKHHG